MLTSTQSAGFLCQEGTDGKPLNVGFAARNAVQAYELVNLGMTAYDDVLSPLTGWFQIFNRQHFSVTAFLDNWLEPAQILSPGLWFKKYPFCSTANAGNDLGEKAYQFGIRG